MALVLLGVSAAGIAMLSMVPIDIGSHEKVFEIPKGTWQRRMSGDPVEILPDRIRLTLGVQDVLVLRNLDDVPQTFGPTLMMPGQSFRLPFERAARYDFACTAHVSGQMTVIVDPNPDTSLGRIAWHARAFFDKLGSYLRS